MAHDPAPILVEFVTFCLERKGYQWPALYDEMCWVASRRLFRGMGYAELSEHGIFLGLTGLDRLRQLAERLAPSASR